MASTQATNVLKRDDLHDYQRYAVNFIESHNESLLILEMGLGKTIVALTAIVDLLFDSFSISKVLIIGPLRVCQSVWPKEKDAWSHTACLRMSVVTGSKKQRIAALSKPADVYVVNRENVKWLVDYYQQNHLPWPFDMCVIDELSSFKNHKSQRFKALRRVRPYMSRVVGLTGSPGSLMDLWAEVGLLDQGKRLGRFITRYREAYFQPDQMNHYTGQIYSYKPVKGAEEEIYRRIGDIAVSMKSVDFLDLPEMVELDHEVQMAPKEKGVYDQMKHDLVVDVGPETITAENAAVLSGKLLQLASGALKTEEGYVEIHQKKLELLKDLVDEAEGEPVLIAYWFRHNRERILAYLKANGYEPKDIRTPEDIEAWNNKQISVGLINPASMGHGINMQKGGYILIWFDEIFSLDMYSQCCARLHRQGQVDVVSVHRLICKDSIDEQVIQSLKDKNTSQERLIAAVKANL
jgi:SNF2 family DNA or RNA helicase